MNQIVVTFEEELDEDFTSGDTTEEGSPQFIFIVRAGLVKSKVCYDQENVTVKEWQEFVDAVKNNSEVELTFLNSNGYLGICTKNGKTCFSVSIYGSSNGGNMYIKVNNKYCITAFDEATAAMARYYNRTQD